MITLEQSIKLANYQITGGSQYLWKCFGPNARYLDFVDNEKISYSVIFDTETQVVYEATISDYARENHYLLLNKEYREDYIAESDSRGSRYNQVYDDVNYVELEEVNDFVEKADAIINGKEYDDRVSIPLDFDDALLFKIMIAAHKEDLTLNQFIEKSINSFINK